VAGNLTSLRPGWPEFTRTQLLPGCLCVAGWTQAPASRPDLASLLQKLLQRNHQECCKWLRSKDIIYIRVPYVFFCVSATSRVSVISHPYKGASQPSHSAEETKSERGMKVTQPVRRGSGDELRALGPQHLSSGPLPGIEPT
jgi:hypothetical protein